MPEFLDLINLDKIAKHYKEFDWEKLRKEIWDQIGWGKKNGIVTNENWEKYGTMVKHDVCGELHRIMGHHYPSIHCGTVVAYYVMVKRLKSDYYHPVFDVLN